MATAIELEQPERKGTFKRWKPKKWRPEYDRIVAYAVMGKSNVWIAKQLSFTPEHVSTILHQPQAIELAEKLHVKLRETIETNIPGVLSDIAGKAVKRLNQIMDDDDLFKASPFAVVDRGLDVLKGLRHLTGGGNGSAQPGGGNTIFNGPVAIVTPAQRSSILEGLEKVGEVKRLHATND